MVSSSSCESDNDTEKTFSDIEERTSDFHSHKTPNFNADQPFEDGFDSSSSLSSDDSAKDEWEVECIEGTHILDSQPCRRFYKVRFKGWPEPEWHEEEKLYNALELVRCFWETRMNGREACLRAQRELIAQLDQSCNTDDESSPESNTLSNENLCENHSKNDHNEKLKETSLKHLRNKKRSRKPKRPRREHSSDSDFADSSSDSSQSDGEKIEIPEGILSRFEELFGPGKTAELEELWSKSMEYEPVTPECKAQIDVSRKMFQAQGSQKNHETTERSPPRASTSFKVPKLTKNSKSTSNSSAQARTKVQVSSNQNETATDRRNGTENDVDELIDNNKLLKTKTTNRGESLRKTCLRKVKRTQEPSDPNQLFRDDIIVPNINLTVSEYRSPIAVPQSTSGSSDHPGDIVVPQISSYHS